MRIWKMRIWSLLALLCLLTLPANLAQANEPQTTKVKKTEIDRWTYLLKLIEEEEKTINMVKRKTDHLMYRLFELKTERIKLYKEKENKAFLSADHNKKKISRKKAFRQTLNRYNSTRRYGLSILKRYPRTRYKAAIYHTLALNSRDYAYDNRELGYLYKAIKNTRKRSETWFLAMTSLAEYFYNEKKYKRAVGLYDQIINNTEDQWHTKNLYNYGWCLLKTHKFKRAIDRLEEGYKLSFNTKYIDFREQIMHSLVSFYVLGKEIDRGIKFVMEYDKRPFEALARFARKTSEKGFFAETEKLVDLAEDNFDKGKETEQLADLRLFQFDFYDQYRRDSKIFEMAGELASIKLTDYQKEEAIRKISEKARTEQIILKKDFDKVQKAYSVARLDNLIKYFGHLSKLDRPNDAMYRYFTAETLYSVQEYKRSLKEYKVALETQLKTPSKMDLNRKVMDGIFSSIDFARLKKEEEKNELEYAYLKFLQLWPKDKKAPTVHQKLFAIYLSRKDHQKMEDALAGYNKAFPKDDEVQRKLFRQRMDLSIKDEDTFRLATLVKKMQGGYLEFQREETKKSEVILANLLFNKFQKMNEEGATEDAIAGYKKVFYNAHYPQSTIAEAGFNIGILYTDIYEAAKSVKWFKKSFPLFTDKEKMVKKDYIEKMSKRSALLQDFLNAAHMQRIVLDNFCHLKKENKKNLEQALAFDLANDYVLKALHTYNTYKHCSADPHGAQAHMITHFFRNGHSRNLLSFVSEHNLYGPHKTALLDYYERLYWRNYTDQAQKSLFRHELKLLKDERIDRTLAAVKKLENYTDKYENFFRSPIVMGQTFDPAKFNKGLNDRATKLAQMVADSKTLLDAQNPQLTLMVYEQTRNALKSFAQEIESYRPQGMPEEFNKQFLPQMKMLAGTFSKKADTQWASANKLANDYEILPAKRAKSSADSNVLDLVDIRMPASLMANTFDLD